MIIDHVGIVVKNMSRGIEFWKDAFGYTQMTGIVVNTRQKVKVAFMKKENSITIKLTEPIDETSPIFAFAQRGGGLHHLCFKCENLDNQLEEFSKKRFRVLFPPQPGEAFDNENIAFLFAGQGLNIELIDTDKKAEII